MKLSYSCTAMQSIIPVETQAPRLLPVVTVSTGEYQDYCSDFISTLQSVHYSGSKHACLKKASIFYPRRTWRKEDKHDVGQSALNAHTQI